MTKIIVLGSGRVASVLAKGLVGAGHSVVIGRHQSTKRPDWAGEDLAVTDTADAISQADVVLNATPGESAVAFLGAHARALAGKVLVDVSNAVKRDEHGMPCGLAYPDSSVGEELQRHLPDVRVVKTLNTMLFVVMASPGILSRPASVFLSGDDTAAKATVRELLQDLGWQDESIEDLGGIATARGPESFMHFVPPLMARDGMVPFALAIAR